MFCVCVDAIWFAFSSVYSGFVIWFVIDCFAVAIDCFSAACCALGGLVIVGFLVVLFMMWLVCCWLSGLA